MSDPAEQVRAELVRVQAIEAAATRRRHLRRLVPWLTWLFLHEARGGVPSWVSVFDVARYVGLSKGQAALFSGVLMDLNGIEPQDRPIWVVEAVRHGKGWVYRVEPVGLVLTKNGISLD
jgi:hypothetical protein